tara:strand:+ start:1392 stop:1565 length:174 start_codon:yes stop_codon:yes gene_type:complete
MKKIYFLFFLLLSSCSSNKIQGNLDNDFIFSDKMNFVEFEIKVKEYANKSPYPNIDN